MQGVSYGQKFELLLEEYRKGNLSTAHIEARYVGWRPSDSKHVFLRLIEDRRKLKNGLFVPSERVCVFATYSSTQYGFAQNDFGDVVVSKESFSSKYEREFALLEIRMIEQKARSILEK